MSYMLLVFVTKKGPQRKSNAENLVHSTRAIRYLLAHQDKAAKSIINFRAYPLDKFPISCIYLFLRLREAQQPRQGEDLENPVCKEPVDSTKRSARTMI